jgi:hypothetical protein
VLFNSDFYSSPVPSHIPSPYSLCYYYHFSLPLYYCCNFVSPPLTSYSFASVSFSVFPS